MRRTQICSTITVWYGDGMLQRQYCMEMV